MFSRLGKHILAPDWFRRPTSKVTHILRLGPYLCVLFFLFSFTTSLHGNRTNPECPFICNAEGVHNLWAPPIVLTPTSLLLTLGTPTITVRFSNPQFNCETENYCVDVEFQADTAGHQLFGMNVRFFYDAGVLELVDFRGYQGGYGPIPPNPPIVFTSPPGVGYNLFGFGLPGTGIADFVNGGFGLIDDSMTPIYISDTSWTKLFQICFTIVDTTADEDSFCPPLVWDMKQDPEEGGFLVADDGVVITIVDPEPFSDSAPAFENVEQFNWEYIGDGGQPFGQPIESNCINISCGPVITCPDNILIECDDSTLPVNTGSPTAIDYCTGNPDITYVDSLISGTCDQEKMIIRTWTATDECNKQGSCVQIIIINDKGSICGSVFDDLGQPMGDVALRLYADLNANQQLDSLDTLILIVFSDSLSGMYCFTDLEPCEYLVEEVQPMDYGDLFDYDFSPDADGDDSLDGPDNEIPVSLLSCEIDSNNNFVNIVCPLVLPVIPPDTICSSGNVSFQLSELGIGSIGYAWDFGSGSMPSNGMGLGPHLVSFVTTTDNQANGAVIHLTMSKAGCPQLSGEVSIVRVNPYPNATIDGSTQQGCYYTNRIYKPLSPELPGASYSWSFGTGAVPSTAMGYGPHTVYYTSNGTKTVKLVIHPNQAGAQCPDSSNLVFLITNCPASITGFVRSTTNDPIPNVTVRLYNDINMDGMADDTIVRSVQTTALGTFAMANLIPRNYILFQVQPSGWFSADDYDLSPDGDIVSNISPLDNIIPVTLTPLKSDAGNYFIETAAPGDITGAVFVDDNNNMIHDQGEGLSDVVISLYADVNSNGIADSGIPVTVQTTSALGNYSVLSIPVGHYVIVETQPIGYMSVKDFDSTNDGDVVPNINMMNDTIPVTITNLEVDANNYFIDEVECTLTVTNTNDDGGGSLRHNIECAEDGDTILFHASLAGDTIKITSGIINIHKDIVILSTMNPRITIASQVTGLFFIGNDASVEFKDLDLISGLSLGNYGAAYENEGLLLLNSMHIFKNEFFTPGHFLIRNVANGELQVAGVCIFHEN